jgi:hypothetical protein
MNCFQRALHRFRSFVGGLQYQQQALQNRSTTTPNIFQTSTMIRRRPQTEQVPRLFFIKPILTRPFLQRNGRFVLGLRGTPRMMRRALLTTVLCVGGPLLLADSPTGTAIGVQNGGTPIGGATVFNCGTDLTCTVSHGILTVTASGGGADPCTQAISATPSGLHCNTVTLSQANILALDSTPFTLVSAPGAGLVAFPFAQRWKYTAVTTPYRGTCTTSQYVAVWWQNNVNPFTYIYPSSFPILVGPPPLTWPNFAGLSSTAAMFASGMFPYSDGNGTPVDPANYANQPIVLELLPGNTGCFNFGTVTAWGISAAGTSYNVGDEIIAANCALFRITGVSGGGGITTFTVIDSQLAQQGSTVSFMNLGNISSSTLNLGGAGYAAGNTGTVTTGNGDATYTVNTIGAGGAVATYTLTMEGTGYMSGTAVPTMATTGIGTGFLLNIIAGTGSGFVGVANTVTPGDGTLTITTWYTVAGQ